MMPALWIALGGAAGAAVRHAAHIWLRAPGQGASPRGTALVNLTGAFLAGVLAGAASDASSIGTARLLVGLGFLGALTTFSTWMLEVIDMAGSARTRLSILHLVGLLAAGVALAWAGLALTG